MEVYINFNGLPSWLALAPLGRIVAETGVAVRWQPMLGNLGNVAGSNLKPGEEDPLAAYKARRAKARSRAKARELERMCETLGIDPEAGGRTIDPTALSLGLNWIVSLASAEDQARYIESAFERTYRESGDVESIEAVADLIDSTGISSRGFAEFCEREQAVLEATRDEILEKSVLNAPAFILDGEVFNGREHLPLIEWILKGREGTPPV